MIAAAFVRYLIFAGVLAGTVGLSWYAFKEKYYNQGWTAAMHAIAAQNEKAVKEANDARNTVKACFDTGGTWDIAAGDCLRPDGSSTKSWWH